MTLVNGRKYESAISERIKPVRQETSVIILSRAPTRITLGGGGTDLASYYSKYGGFLIAGAINRYCTILANKRFYESIRLSYKQVESEL